MRPLKRGNIMSIKFAINPNGCEIRTMGKNGIETIVSHSYEKAMERSVIVRCMRNNTQAAGSMRQASLSFIHEIQTSGMIDPWFNSQTVHSDLLKKMREAEEKLAVEFGMTADDVAEMRKPGAYADTRSHALKAWGFGIALKTGVDETGNVNLLTTSALRQINASKRKEPETKTIDDLLAKVAEFLMERPQDVVVVEEQTRNMIKAARAMLDSAALILAGQTTPALEEKAEQAGEAAKLNSVKPEPVKALTKKQKAAMLYASKEVKQGGTQPAMQ
jgi:hypothetical protein